MVPKMVRRIPGAATFLTIFFATFSEGRLFDAFGPPLGSLLVPCGSLWAPFGLLLAPIGSLLAPFGHLLGRIWCYLVHFCSPHGSIFSFWYLPAQRHFLYFIILPTQILQTSRIFVQVVHSAVAGTRLCRAKDYDYCYHCYYDH